MGDVNCLTMRQRIAWAMDSALLRGGIIHDANQDDFLRAATKVLTVMRLPTSVMCVAGGNCPSAGLADNPHHAQEIYTAMIDAELDEFA